VKAIYNLHTQIGIEKKVRSGNTSALAALIVFFGA